MAEETNLQKSNVSEPNSDKTKTEPNIISESQINLQQSNQTEQKHPIDDINHCCRDCIRWDKYGEKCFYWWKGKRYCSRRVTSMEELEHENLFLG